MTNLRTAAQQALEALAVVINDDYNSPYLKIVAALRAALEEPEGGGNLPPPLPGDFDHAIGADRFKVVRGAFWWHVLIGDSPTKHGKFHSRTSAEKMAADLLREFRNGAFVQHEAALEEPVQEPVAWRFKAMIGLPWSVSDDGYYISCKRDSGYIIEPLYTAPPQRKPLTEEEIYAAIKGVDSLRAVEVARAIERAHGIGGQDEP